MTHYSSSTLADATAGKRLPTEAVVKAFVTACGEDPADWIAELHRAARQTDAANRPPAAGSGTRASLGPQEQPAPGPPPGPRTPRRLPPRGALVAVAVAAACGLLWVGAAIGAAARPAHSAAAGLPVATAPFTSIPSTEPSAVGADGSDPHAAGCAKDARLVDKSPVMIDGAQVGALELMYSAHCGSGWARAYLYPGRPTMMAEVTVRSADGRAMSLSEPMIKQVPVYTEVVAPGEGGCLGARAVVLAPGGRLATASIPCQAP